MSLKFDTALDDCLDLLAAGASVEDCLARYPEHAEELRPLVSLAFAVKRVPTPRPDLAAVHANRLRMIDALRQRRRPTALGWDTGVSRGLQAWATIRTAISLAAVILLVTLAAGAIFSSAAGSLPGQTLYPVKRFGENVRLSLTLNPAARQELQAEYLAERQREVWQVLDAGYQAILEFRGELTEIGDGYWMVGGLRVVLDNETLVEGHVAVGAIVAVRALSTGDGALRALELQVLTEPLRLTVVATDTPTPVPSATSTATPTMALTPSAVPTATPSPSLTPTATPSPTATYTPTQTEEPESTDLPDEDETHEPEPTDLREEDKTQEPDSATSLNEDEDEAREPNATARLDEDDTIGSDAGDQLGNNDTGEPASADHPCQADKEGVESESVPHLPATAIPRHPAQGFTDQLSLDIR